MVLFLFFRQMMVGEVRFPGRPVLSFFGEAVGVANLFW